MWHRHDDTWETAENAALTAVGFFAVGAGVMYLLDPQRGPRRRAVIRDKAVSGYRENAACLTKTGQYLRDSARGLVADTKALFREERVSDYKIGARVRSAMGRVVANPSAILVTVVDGDVTLCGDVWEGEFDGLTATAKSVRGVRYVRNALRIHPHGTKVQSLQAHPKQAPSRFPLMQDNWSPLTRLLVGAAGGAMGTYGVVRRDWIGAALGVVGLGFLTRSATNMPAARLVGIGAGPRAIDVQKTVNINAPLGPVFGFFSRYENFPRFMANVKEVTDYGTGYSHWVVAGPAGIEFEWDAELTEFIPHERIAWQSVTGSTVDNAGILRFQENPDGTTRVDIRLSYNPPGGALGHLVALAFGADPKSEMDEDLKRVKTMIETGNAPRDAARPLAVAAG